MCERQLLGTLKGRSIGEALESELAGAAWLVPGTTEALWVVDASLCHARKYSRYADAVPRLVVSNAT